ncbi:MAG: DUF808 family protein, partial [Oleibacter sp.]|nr:DUF808 family protein [Thalassolituus sp.]
LKNKMILVPAALLISAFMPAAIMWLLMVGGAYLCFEGTEKILHSIFHKDAKEEEKAARQAALLQPEVDMVELEKEKIKGAIRTDFILSAEIIVISLGSIAAYTLPLQIVVLSFLALLFTFGIYGIVAGIVKMDDVGLWMLKRGKEGGIQQAFGKGLLWVAPQLMKVLSFVGTLAMFIVGGGIIVHGIPYLSHINHEIELWVANLTHVHLLGTVGSLGAQVVLGFTVGALLVGVMSAWQAVNRNKEAH